MKKVNPFKIYFLAIFYLFVSKNIRHRCYFKKTPIESLAIGTVMTKIVYWKKLLFSDSKKNRKIFFTEK